MPSLVARDATFQDLLDELSQIAALLKKQHKEELDKLRSSMVEEARILKRRSSKRWAKTVSYPDVADVGIEPAPPSSANELMPQDLATVHSYECEEETSMNDARCESEAVEPYQSDSFRTTHTWTTEDVTGVTFQWNHKRQFFQFSARSPWSEEQDFEHLRLATVMEGLDTMGIKASYESAGSLSTLARQNTRMRFHSSANSSLQPRSCIRQLVLHPTSRFRTFWVLACMALLLYDLAMVPLDLSFEPEETFFFKAMDLISATFWSLDIPLNFFTGVYIHDKLEMRPSVIALRYLKSWFFPDLFLVLPDWLANAIENFPGGHITVFRFVRWGRLLRLLRLARGMRFAKLKPLLRWLAIEFHLSRAYVACFYTWIGSTLSLCVIVHLLACFWYAFGNALENGWVQANDLKKEELNRRYMISARWTFARFHGLEHGEPLETTWELLVDTLLIYSSLVLSSFYIGRVATVCIAGASSSTANLWKMCISYGHKHRIPPTLQFRVMKMLESSHWQCASDVKRNEEMLLEALPLGMQQDLLYEARHRFLMTLVFFSDVNAFNSRVVRQICNEAMTVRVAYVTEALFASADACTEMRVVESGQARYFHSGDIPNLSSDLNPFSIMSEAVLWTKWEHVGKAVCLEESTIMSVDATLFAEVILQYKSSTLHAIRYAKHFVWNLNHLQKPNDLSSFHDLTVYNLDEGLYHDTTVNHFIFISHYKVESGTEATLIRDLMLTILHEDTNHPANFLQSPIFIDSEDLVDLARLKEDVIGSATLVVLLTPSVFSRPWCLIEIVTAMRHSVNVVPVEIQRPGCSYKYPDEEFYAGVLAGTSLDKGGERLLAQEGISLEEVVTAIREIFMKIALPFSPHKSKLVREAELKDILKRCNNRLRELIREPGAPKNRASIEL